MQWTKNNYPESMKSLTPDVREKAIDIANALLENKEYDEERAIAVAISRAKEWSDQKKAVMQE